MANVNELLRVLTREELGIIETALRDYSQRNLLTAVAQKQVDILHGQIKAAQNRYN